MIFGLSRSVFFAGLIATAGAAGGLWYVLSEDERSAPVAQRESVTTQEAAPSQPGARAPAEETAQVEAQPEEAADAPSDDPATGTPPADETAAQASRDGIEDMAQDALAESDAQITQIETLIEEDVAALGDPAAPAPALESEPEVAQPRLPAFDTIRVEPTGEAVIAGRDAPEGDVTLLRDGEIYDETFAGPSGAFVFIPQPFPVGTSDVTLRATDAQGNVLMSRESVTIIVDAERARMPMVALTAPGRPTEVLSRPEPVQVAEVAAQDTSAEMAMEARPTSDDTGEPGNAAEAPAGSDAAGTDVAQQAAPETAAPESDASDAGNAGTTTPAPDAMPADETGTAVAAIDPEADTTAEPVSERAGVRIVAVEAETGGGLFVSGEADAQAAIRLYLNDTLVARAEADDAGDVSFAIRRGVRAGRYQVRLDDVDPATGTVLSRAEVGFTVPEAMAALSEPEAESPPAAEAQMPAGSDAQEAAMQETRLQDAESADTAAAEPARDADTPSADASSDAASVVTGEAESPAGAPTAVQERAEATVTVPELSTALVERGDSLWRISRQVYGRGVRYTEIFEANQDQIRNPNLIYPGQVFVLPPDAEAAQDGQDAEAPAAQ
ncbi:MAG: LysM peptidoglycan-binding domain-containing protein [Salinarimonas sp.]